jgi:uncharacterized membrane protein
MGQSNEREFPHLRIELIRPIMPFRFLLSGGVSLRIRAPGWSFGLCRQIEMLSTVGAINWPCGRRLCCGVLVSPTNSLDMDLPMTALSPVKLSMIARRLDMTFLLHATIAYFLLTTFSKQIYLFFDYGSSLGLRDLALYQQALHNFITGGTFETSLSLHNPQSIFGEHAFIFLVFFIPLYYIFQTPLLLMLSQPLAYILMMFVVYKILKDLYKEERTIVYLILVLLLLNPIYSITLQNFNIYGFHPEFYFPPLFLAAYYFYVKDNFPLFTTFYLLSLTIIEYYSFIWITLSFYAIFVAKNSKRIDFFVFTCSLVYLTFTVLFFIPHFRGTSLPWYMNSLSMPGFDFDPTKIVNLAKTLSINLLFNFAIFLFLPLKNRQTLILLLPFYLAATLAYLNGYLFPLSAGSWHGNAVIPLILLGYMNEFEKVAERRTKMNILKAGFAIAILLSVAVQVLRPAYSQGTWAILNKYSALRNDYDSIQNIKREMRNQPTLVSFQLGKYFGDFKDVNLLENESKIGPNIRYLVYYSGGGSLDDQRLREIKQNYSATKQYKDVILFEKLATD